MTHLNGKLYLLICHDTTKFVMLSNFALIEMICPKVWARPLPKNVKRSLTVDLRRSKTSLL